MNSGIDTQGPMSGDTLGDFVEDPVIEDVDTASQIAPPAESDVSSRPPDVDNDHSPDFVSLLSLLDAYFTEEHFPVDGKTPRILDASFPSLAMQGSPLGSGRTFSVWRLQYKGSVYAVKQPRLAERTYKGVLTLILLELRVLTLPPLISHENIVGLVGYGWEYRSLFESNGGAFPFLIVEYCEHGTIASFISKGDGIGLQTRKSLILDVARGILALHEVGIAHCDVRCENVLICSHATREYVAKITDFGFAIADVDDPRIATGGGQPAVSYPCCAPEAFGFVKLEHFRFLDIYSYGIVALSVLLSTHNPFQEFFSSLEASQGSLPIDKDLMVLRRENNVDIHDRVADVKAQGLTEVSMLWMLSQANWAERLDVTMAKAVVTATLKALPPARNLYAAALAIAQSLRMPDASADLEDASGKMGLASRDLGTLYKDFPWQPLLTSYLITPTIPLFAKKKYMLDLEARFRAFPAPQYLIMLANYSLHGFGSGSLLPQPDGLDWLGMEARMFDGDDDPFMWFRVWRYFEALGVPPPDSLRGRARDILSSAARIGSVVAMQALRRTHPELHWDITHEISWELRGLDRKFSRMASAILPLQGTWPHESSGPSMVDEPVRCRILEEVRALWEEYELFRNTRETMLHAAAAHGNLDLARQILKLQLVEIDAKNVDGQTPLFQGCRGGHLELVEFLITEGADATIQDVCGETCLHSAFAFPPAHVGRLVDLLVSKGVEVNAVCNANPMVTHQTTEKCYCPGSPLHRAVHTGAKAAALALLQHGADPWLEAPEWDRPDTKPAVWLGTVARSTITPIQLACKLGHFELLDELLENAPPPSGDFDRFGDTLVCAVDEDSAYGYYLHGKDYPKAVESVVHVLKNRGADFSRAAKSLASDDIFVSALAYAAWTNRLDLVKALVPLFPRTALDCATQFSVSPRRWYKPLHHAIKHGNEALCRTLLAAGASCQETEVDNTSEGVVFIGLCAGLPNAVSLAAILADHGAAIDIGSSANLTPLFAAVIAGQLELADFLMSRGADIRRRIDDTNLLGHMLQRLDEPTEKQLLYALDNMGATWDTFITNCEAGTETSVFMDVAARSSKASNTIRWLTRFLLETFPEPSYLDYHTPTGVNAVDVAIGASNLDVCQILVGAGALRDSHLRQRTLRYALERLHAPLPDEVLQAGDAAAKKFKQDRELVLEIFLPYDNAAAYLRPNEGITICEGSGPARGEFNAGGI
ncbi:hypothetical protein B0T10DRAFT_467321 [Thelonectria olida]|uniref:Protein kinase domain-containing protein n=1 Tax=Thelonectria olida TaxID=1576542 RepID=A0A9P8VR68_9HYPO|nr:hypothetical protein B0T10DRAFT_467321 [Thelonectria olida]